MCLLLEKTSCENCSSDANLSVPENALKGACASKLTKRLEDEREKTKQLLNEKEEQLQRIHTHLQEQLEWNAEIEYAFLKLCEQHIFIQSLMEKILANLPEISKWPIQKEPSSSNVQENVRNKDSGSLSVPNKKSAASQLKEKTKPKKRSRFINSLKRQFKPK